MEFGIGFHRSSFKFLIDCRYCIGIHELVSKYPKPPVCATWNGPETPALSVSTPAASGKKVPMVPTSMDAAVITPTNYSQVILRLEIAHNRQGRNYVALSRIDICHRKLFILRSPTQHTSFTNATNGYCSSKSFKTYSIL